MAKKIVFYAVDNGIEGRSKDSRPLYASFDEDELKAMHLEDKSSQWRTLKEKIIEVDGATHIALNKLDGIDKLILGL